MPLNPQRFKQNADFGWRLHLGDVPDAKTEPSFDAVKLYSIAFPKV